jgi:hypothetical protein
MVRTRIVAASICALLLVVFALAARPTSRDICLSDPADVEAARWIYLKLTRSDGTYLYPGLTDTEGRYVGAGLHIGNDVRRPPVPPSLQKEGGLVPVRELPGSLFTTFPGNDVAEIIVPYTTRAHYSFVLQTDSASVDIHLVVKDSADRTLASTRWRESTRNAGAGLSRPLQVADGCVRVGP